MKPHHLTTQDIHAQFITIYQLAQSFDLYCFKDRAKSLEIAAELNQLVAMHYHNLEEAIAIPPHHIASIYKQALSNLHHANLQFISEGNQHLVNDEYIKVILHMLNILQM
ncbi:hypothetical protein ACF3N8_04470 [Staphylococcus massiliensis]|uniref:hypothetical protein n=1 Tax=Staphylococcus massiliensis TaxID=555791 RepID=UPI001EDDFEDA|nr:hypothetical protein [Staphylococcus massiliensis]MCG3402471.1 hypothetical protein [Staphylococcus massiliensis]MCG3411565.1 hypothetical protein [Staphylococcus massiliensis]